MYVREIGHIKLVASGNTKKYFLKTRKMSYKSWAITHNSVQGPIVVCVAVV